MKNLFDLSDRNSRE